MSFKFLKLNLDIIQKKIVLYKIKLQVINKWTKD